MDVACWWRISLGERVSTWRPRGHALVRAIATVSLLVWMIEQDTYAPSISRPPRRHVRSRSQPKISRPPMRIPRQKCRAADVPPKDVRSAKGTYSRSSVKGVQIHSWQLCRVEQKEQTQRLDPRRPANAASRPQARQGRARNRAL